MAKMMAKLKKFFGAVLCHVGRLPNREWGKKMNYKQCVTYVMKHKLYTYSSSGRNGWLVSDLKGHGQEAPDYITAVNTYKARYEDTPCDAA